MKNTLVEQNALIEKLNQRIKEITLQIGDMKKQYELIRMKPRVEFSIKEKVEDVMTQRKVLRKIPETDESFKTERKSLVDRIKMSLSRKHNINNTVFAPNSEELTEIVPEGSKVKIKRIEKYEWTFGTKRFKFTKDTQGNIYAKTKDGEVLFDDFVSIYEQSELRKRNEISITNIKNMEESRDFADADFNEIGDEHEKLEESESCLAEKIKKFN